MTDPHRPIDHDDPADVAARADQSPFARLVGAKITVVEPGRAVAEMVVAPDHLNLYGFTHGGALFTLADHAGSVAGNSVGRKGVATHIYMTYFGNPEVGRTIRAEARVINTGKRLGQVEVVVSDESGRRLALCQGGICFLD